MDRASLDAGEHARALAGLQRLNSLSRCTAGIWRQIVKNGWAKRGRLMRILDIASGGGDVALDLWRRAKADGIDVEVLGLDRSATACAIAALRCQPAAQAVRFQVADVTRTDLPCGYDIVTCSLFLHHLSRDDAVALLGKMAAASPRLLLSDLRRSVVGYAAALAACHLVTRSHIVRYDGPQSVVNAFTLAEVRELCRAAGLEGAGVRRAWPWRLMVSYGGDGP